MFVFCHLNDLPSISIKSLKANNESMNDILGSCNETIISVGVKLLLEESD